MKKEKVYNYLKEKNIPIYSIKDHRAVYTMEEADELGIELDGSDCKNLFLRAKKEKIYFLISIMPHKRADMKKLAETLGVKRLNFASENDLNELLGLTKGSVSPMGLINDEKKYVIEYFMGREFEESQRICFHPNTNAATITLDRDEFIRFLNSLGRGIQWIDI